MQALRDRLVWDETVVTSGLAAPDDGALVLAPIPGPTDGVRIVLRDTLTELTSFGRGGRQPSEFFGVHSIATDSKGNIYTTETYEGKRIPPYGKPVEIEVPPGPDICVSTEWEIEAETYALFARGGMPWPNRDWEVRVETFCFYRN